jgi:hypothetical protein
MALGLKILIQVDISGGSLWFTDKTGEYDVTTNDTGWGAATKELSESALVWSVVRNAMAGDEKISPVSFDVSYDDGAGNADETIVEFAYGLDGWYTITMFRLPVSNNNSDIIGGGTLSEEDYYYDTQTGLVSQLISAAPVVVDDFEVMVGNVDVVQVTCEEIFYSKLAIKTNDLYKIYQAIRDTKGGDYKESRNALAEVTDIREDIRGADYAFRSGLTTQAQDIIETALTRYDIV